MFMNTTMGGTNIAFPDVCNTPTPSGPVPIPYPNISNGAMCNPSTAVLNVLVGGMPAINSNSQILISNGDNAGIAGGVVSAVMMGPTRFLLGSSSVMTKGMPAMRLTSTTGHNGMSPNAIGQSLMPSQTKVAVMK